ncbi:helix-turn-helix domain-containing protein [Streptomyces sp. NPDC049881]|uniref:helix-turn-helix transcriptional regulator n=1 Tax=Streptomyces sp. NPDC049881 TaxID=3155778 RepID=UPI00342C5578
MTAPLSAAEVLALPAMATVEQACAALQISARAGYDLRKRGEFPVPVLHLGSKLLRVRRADLLAYLGLANDGVGSSHPTPSETAPIRTSSNQ